MIALFDGIEDREQAEGLVNRPIAIYRDQFSELPDDELQWKLEQSIRNYDPCISCATHFLDLTVDRGCALRSTSHSRS